MMYYTLVTLFVAWGFLALIALVGGVVLWYVGYAVYSKLEDVLAPVVDALRPGFAALLNALRPQYEALRARVQAVTANYALPLQLRSR